jgi:broad-specificity NMP kinase
MHTACWLIPFTDHRGYPPSKVQENVECEIMMVILEEARDSYR